MSQWYLIAYDVREPRRLQRLHRYLSRRSIALQHSLYLYSEHECDIDELLAGMREHVLDREDDLRLYPIRNPGTLWVAGNQALAMEGLYPAGSKKTGLLSKMVQIVTGRRSKK